METVTARSKTNNNQGSDTPHAKKAASAPILPKAPECKPVLKPQISAPSYLVSLKENESPPFEKSGNSPRPMLLIGTIMNEMEAIEMVAAMDSENGLRKWLSNFLLTKKITHNYKLREKTFLISLVSELMQYSAQREFSCRELAACITLYLNTHLYFKRVYWNSPTDVWEYFKETLLRHTVDDSPYGEEVFSPEESFGLLSHFHTVYLTNLPLVHILTHGVHRLKLQWPFTPKYCKTRSDQAMDTVMVKS